MADLALYHILGFVPAALIGVDIFLLLIRARRVKAAGHDAPALESPSAWLGAIMAGGALTGQDKLTFIISPPLDAFGCWLEQLLAESLGKDGKGVLPIVGESVGSPAHAYGADRIFVYMRLDGDSTHDVTVSELEGRIPGCHPENARGLRHRKGNIPMGIRHRCGRRNSRGQSI